MGKCIGGLALSTFVLFMLDESPRARGVPFNRYSPASHASSPLQVAQLQRRMTFALAESCFPSKSALQTFRP